MGPGRVRVGHLIAFFVYHSNAIHVLWNIEYQMTNNDPHGLLATERGRWIALAITAVGCAVASGPVSAWPTILPLLISEHLFDGPQQQAQFDACYGLSMVMMLAIGLPAGWLFDRLGGRWCGVAGALIAAVGLAGMAAATRYAKGGSSSLMFIAYPLCMGGGMLNTYSLYSFLWFLPEHQSFVTGVAGGVMTLSDMFALVAVWLHNAFGFSIVPFFLGLSIAAAVVAVVSALVVPEHHVTMATAAVVMSGRSVDDVTETDVANEIAKQSDRSEARAGICSPDGPIRRSCEVMRRHLAASMLIMVFSCVYFQSLNTPTMDMLFYYKTIFDTETSNDLVDVYALLYGGGGFVCSMYGGALCDKLGLARFIALISVVVMITTLSLLVRSYTAQIMAQLSIVFGMSLYTIVVTRFSMHYCPPELFGSFTGVLFTYIGLMMGASAAANAALVALLPKNLQYSAPFVFFGLTAAALGLHLSWWWSRNPPPNEGAATAQGPGVDHAAETVAINVASEEHPATIVKKELAKADLVEQGIALTVVTTDMREDPSGGRGEGTAGAEEHKAVVTEATPLQGHGPPPGGTAKKQKKKASLFGKFRRARRAGSGTEPPST